jgi:hypothetical protein
VPTIRLPDGYPQCPFEDRLVCSWLLDWLPYAVEGHPARGRFPAEVRVVGSGVITPQPGVRGCAVRVMQSECGCPMSVFSLISTQRLPR